MKNNKLLFITTFVIFFNSFSIYSQSNDFLQKFVAGNLSDKIEVLKNNSGNDELFNTSMVFIANYYKLLENDANFKPLILETISGLNNSPDVRTVSELKQIYTFFNDSEIRISIIKKLPTFNSNISELVNLINQYVLSELQNNNLTNNEIFNEAVICLASCANNSSFQILFSCLSKGISDKIDIQIEQALKKMAEDNRSTVIAVIANNPPDEKLLALEISQNNSKKTDFFPAEIAENALAIAINNSGEVQDIPSEIITLQLKAMRIISEAAWTRASSLMVRYFELAKKQYAANLIPKEAFIEIIQCLSKLGTTETGNALSSYLATLNLETEKNGTYDKDILLAVINSLGVLGDKSAFDYLLYVISFSNYSEEIIAASRDALARLKW